MDVSNSSALNREHVQLSRRGDMLRLLYLYSEQTLHGYSPAAPTRPVNIPNKARQKDAQFSRFNVSRGNCFLEMTGKSCHSDEFNQEKRDTAFSPTKPNRIRYLRN